MYNGLYGILPRQYIATELFERVEVQRGASAFLNGMAPGGNNIGGTVSVLPKRASNEGLNRLTANYGAGKRGGLAADVARRFGQNQEFGVRVNAAHHNGKTAIDDEKSKLSLVNVGLDWRNENARLSADLGWQDNKLKATRTNVTLSGMTAVPAAPDASSNWAQPWTYSNERDWFGTMRGEYDFNDNLTAYAAYGFRRSKENNSLANLTVGNVNGDGSIYRFDNARKDKIDTGEIGLRGKFNTGAVEHEWTAAANRFQSSRKNAYIMDWGNQYTTNLYNPSRYPQPAAADPLYSGNDMGNPAVTGKTRLTSFALGDTFSLWDKRLQFMLGARWQQVHNKAYAYNTGAQTENYKNRASVPPPARCTASRRIGRCTATTSKAWDKARLQARLPPSTAGSTPSAIPANRSNPMFPNKKKSARNLKPTASARDWPCSTPTNRVRFTLPKATTPPASPLKAKTATGARKSPFTGKSHKV